MTSRKFSRSSGVPSLAAAIALIGAFGLAACDRTEEPRTAGQQVDVAVGKAKEAADQARSATEQAAAGAKAAVTDAAITAAVKAELARDSELSALSINVDTTEGRVALQGTAPNALARDRATRLAAAVEGVRKVENQLTLKGNG
jgi:hyperosmotically inducible periplasmic protein